VLGGGGELPEGVRAERVLVLRRLVDCLEGQWLGELAGVDACGAAGAEQGIQAASTASWLRSRLHLGASAATSAVRTARALFRGPLMGAAQALRDGEISTAHASALAHGTRDLPAQVAAEAEPVLLEAARRLDPPRLRRVIGHLLQVADPEAADRQAERQHSQRWLWLAPTLEGMVAIDRLLEAEAGQTLLAALDPLARPANAEDTRSGAQRRADALAELARRALEAGQLPQTGGVRPQLNVIVDLDSLLGRPGAVGGEVGWAGPISPEACRRLACDDAVTRVLVTRGPTGHHGHHGDPSEQPGGYDHPGGGHEPGGHLPTTISVARSGWGTGCRRRWRCCRRPWGAPPASRWTWAAPPESCLRPSAPPSPSVMLAVCFPTVPGRFSWCEAHHLLHWVDGGPTDLANLALLCRQHHRTVHEGGWQLTRGPDGRFTATPAHRAHPPHRRHRGAA
jgi:hypothetical protein